MIAFLIAACFALEPEEAKPVPQVTAISGEGGLTAGFDASGVLTALRWPNPGGANMIRGTSDTESIGGGRWGIEVNGAWRWFGDRTARSRQDYAAPESDVIVTTVEWPDGVIVRQRAAVVPEHDVFVSGVEVTGARSEPRVVWIAEFAPTTRQVPEAGGWVEAFDASRRFAAFTDRENGQIWNFRPSNPGKEDWTVARELSSAGEPVEKWTKFDDGVWIALSSGGPMRSAAVTGSVRELVGAIDSRATVFNSIVGLAVSAIEPGVEKKDGVHRAWVAIRIGESYPLTTELPSDIDVWSVLDDTEQSAELPNVIGGLAPAVVPYAARHWMTLRALHDAESGFTVRSLSEAQDWPREGALAAWALEYMDEHAPTTVRLDAYTQQIRMDDRPRQPFGSMPESLYTSGTIASPHFVVDDRAPGYVLGMAKWILHDRLTIDAYQQWVKGDWPVIEAAGEFLSTWADARRGAPLWCDDPIELSDAKTQDRLFAAYAGISAAIRLAQNVQEPVPDAWRARQDQLRELVEWVLTTPGKWQVGDALALELEGLSIGTLLQLHESTVQRLENPIGLSARQLASLLFQATLLHNHAPEHFSHPSDRVILDVLARIGDTTSVGYAGPDSFVSAQVLLALVLRQASMPQDLSATP